MTTRMELALCPNCRVIHQIVSPTVLDSIDEGRAYDITHCKLCETASGMFLPLKKDVPADVLNDIGYPSAVVPVFGGQYRDWWLVSREQLAKLARAGLRARLLQHLADEMRVDAEHVASWIGHPSPDSVKPSADKTLDPEQGLRLLWIARLIGQVEEVVARAGKSADFDAPAWMGDWLQALHPALGSVNPGAYLLRSAGPETVSELLSRLESCAYS